MLTKIFIGIFKPLENQRDSEKMKDKILETKEVERF